MSQGVVSQHDRMSRAFALAANLLPHEDDIRYSKLARK